MMRIFLLVRRRLGCLPLLAALLLALPAHAGNISFNLSLTGQKLTLTNQGNTSAFHPTVLRMLADGSWEALPPLPARQVPVELAPNTQFELAWPDLPAPANPASIDALRPVMVRFFDQAGAGFGQISFFNQPEHATEEVTLAARYIDGRMTITPPDHALIRASWLLWPQENGIAPLATPLQLQQQQPAARRIEWRRDMAAPSLDLGKGMPIAFLVHETAQGLRSQVVADGRVQGRQQRTGWLNAAPQFYFLARLAAIAAAALMLWQLAGNWRKRNAT